MPGQSLALRLLAHHRHITSTQTRACRQHARLLAELYPGLPLWVDNVEEFVETLGAGILAAEELDRRALTPCAAAPPLGA